MKSNKLKLIVLACATALVSFSGATIAATPSHEAPLHKEAGKVAHVKHHGQSHHAAVLKKTSKHEAKHHVATKHETHHHVAKKHHVTKKAEGMTK